MDYRFRSLRPEGVQPQAASSPSPVKTTMANLLTHVPGEASGFYLLGLATLRAASPNEPTNIAELGGLFFAALVLLVLVRVLAGAGSVLIATSAVAFGLWMAISEDGFVRHALDIEKPVYWVIAAAFFSAVVTALANAGRIK